MNEAVLITGGAKRIGKAVALSLAEKGYDVALHYRSSQKDAEKVQNQIQEKGVACDLFQADLNVSKDVLALIPKVVKRFPDLCLLVNSASIFGRARLMETEPDLFDRHFNTNLKAPFFLSRDFAKHCKGGHIINLLDTKISATLINYFAYTLTKKALAEFTLMAAKELAPGIRVNGIAPGLILPSYGMSQSEFERLGGRIPLQTTGDTDSIVSAVHFFLGNPFVTGDIVYVDGGEHLK